MRVDPKISMNLSLQKGGAYRSGIQALRKQVRSNGGMATIGIVTVKHPMEAQTVDLYLHLAYDPNPQQGAVNGSLYIVGFRSATGAYFFSIDGLELPAGAARLPGNPDGSYASLNCSDELPPISDQSLLDAVRAIGNYKKNDVLDAGKKRQLAQLIIAVSEAIRFDQVEKEIDSVLGTVLKVTPPKDVIRAWGGHFIGN
ncbi:ribosome-inactivating family protein [Massilia sp. MB5]|uniref:ribosome-inactivating family protein n=1 Tax=Massilia sp. MB5 TaxID=2919578 RepID=UPI001F101ED6|nr:ribosome-inactivating family protein [Massilia sp. MB5]UMR30961.1 ribosome-inactivating family protein [Massilia sp. MB5]